MKLSRSFIVTASSFSLAVLAAFFEFKSFESWGQVTRLWESEVNPLSILLHPHMPRYLIVYPGFLLDEYRSGLGFSVYIAAFYAFNMLLLRKVSLLANKCPPSISIYLIFTVIHLAMNGRGVIVWTSWLMCIWVSIKISKKFSTPTNQIGWISLSCLLATVSTGVFVVVLLAFLFVIIRHLKLPRSNGLVKLFIIIPVAAALFSILLEYFLVATKKNIEYYGGGVDGIFNMLTHGIGIIFHEVDILGLAIIFSILMVTGSILFTLIIKRLLTLLDYFILLSLFGGLFGFTVLTLMLPPLLLRIRFSHGFLKWLSEPIRHGVINNKA